MQLEFEVEGVKQLSRRMTRFQTELKDFKTTFGKVGLYLKGFFTNDVFQTEGAIFGERWVPGKFYNKLQRTGKMRRSFIYKNAKDYVLLTNTAPYFKYHQSKLPRKKLPRRIMMKLAERQKQIIVKLFHEDLIAKANKGV